MNSIQCPHCGIILRRKRPDGRCGGCGKPLPPELLSMIAEVPPPPKAPANPVGKESNKAEQASASKQPEQPVVVKWFAGRGHRERGEYETALVIQTELIGLCPSDAMFYRERGWTYLMMRHFDRAIPRNEVRQLLKSLKEGKPVWYATDQG